MPDPISWSLAAPYLIAAFLVGYLLGSIPFGIVLTRLTGAGDLRKIGSGNIGATNVLRTGRKGLAAATLLGDALKGTLAVVLGAQFGPDTAVVAGLGAFLGHLFPVFLKFRGGKGVATFLGVILGLYWPACLVFALVWLGTAFAFRYSSLAALIASVVTTLFFFAFGDTRILPTLGAFLPTPGLSLWQAGELAAVMTALLWIMHRANIGRLLSGTESRIGQKAAQPPAEGTT